MRRVATLAAMAAAVVVAACGGSSKPAAQTSNSARTGGPVTLKVWVGWSARELKVFKGVVAEYSKLHPNVTAEVTGGINDNKIGSAIRAGTAPDVVSSFNSYNVGVYCGTGGWIDL